MTYKNLSVSYENSILVVTLNRPKTLNALNNNMLDEIDQVVTNAKQDESIRSVIFTGEGSKAFCAGADLQELQNLDVLQAKNIIEKGQSVFRKIELLGKPTIAAINGYAFGGGFELSLVCTLRFASHNAKFAFPEVKLGMIPGYGGSQRLPRLINKGKALELLITGRRLDAEEAEALGIVNKVLDHTELLPYVINLANEISENGPLAISHIIQSVEKGVELPIDQGLAIEALLDAISIASDEQKEGVMAFLEKRKPNFRKILKDISR